jgi:hypothetical protein
MRKSVQPQDVLPSPRLRAFLGKRRNRRVLVVTGNLTFLGMLSLLLFTSELSFPWLAMLVLLAVAVCLHGIALNVGTQLIAANRVNALDEREQGVWARAHHRAYRLIAFATGAALLYLGLAATAGLPLPESATGWWVLALLYWGVLVMLPSDVLYWTEPDLEPDPLRGGAPNSPRGDA